MTARKIPTHDHGQRLRGDTLRFASVRKTSVGAIVDLTAMGTLANFPAAGIGAIGSGSYPGTRIYTGSSLFVAYVASATTATQIQATLAFADR